MKRKAQIVIAALILCAPVIFRISSAEAQSSRQTVCQSAWEMCMTQVEGKNWKPVYDRCVKARSVCLAGQAYTPAFTPSTVSLPVQDGGLGNDAANADPESRNARCEKGQMRGNNSSCTLAEAGDGYGQNFSLLGPGVPLSRMQRSSSVVKCSGGTVAMFYPNGRIESCTLDNYGGMGIVLTDYSGKPVKCASRSTARFDAEGRVLSCGQF